MNQSKPKSIWLWIGCAALLSIPLVFLVDQLAKKEPEIVLWSDLRYDGVSNEKRRITEDILRNTILSDIDFDDDPFLDCVDVIETVTNQNVNGSGTLRIILKESVSAVNVPITLRLTEVPVAEALRYTTSLANLKYRVTTDGDVEILPLSDEGALEEGWFDLGPFLFHAVDKSKEKIDARVIIEKAGVDFPEGAIAEYYPRTGLLWARNTRNQLQSIEFLTPMICYPELTWRDRVYLYWMSLTNSHPPPPSSPPVSLPLSPDPFGGGASSGLVEPDPFGGESSTGQSEPDPFGGSALSSGGAPDPFK